MSNLRVIGLIIGIFGLLSTFLIYRGPKWKRSNFILFSLFNLSLIIVSINPNILNAIRDLLALQKDQRGRILALLVISNIFLLFSIFFTKLKVENMRQQFDKLIRNLGASDLERDIDIREEIKPIMVIIPAYNEAGNLIELLPRIPSHIDGTEVGVLVVDDGSEDNTAQVVCERGHLVVSNKINRGQGAASRLGYDILKKNHGSVGVTMDADNQHRPEDLEGLIMPILKDEYDLIIGSRTLGDHDKTIWVRQIGIRIFSKIISLAISQNITDCSSGYKAFNINKLKRLKLTEDQFQSAEVLIEARKKGLRIGEVPITIHSRKHGQSKKGTDWSYGLNFAKTILKTWWR